MKVGRLVAIALLGSSLGSIVAPVSAVAAISPADAAAALGKALVSAANSFSPSAAISSIEAQLALVVEQSGVSDGVAIAALEIAQAVPGISANAKQALAELEALIKGRKHKNNIGSLGGGSGGDGGSGGPGFVGGGGSTDYHH